MTRDILGMAIPVTELAPALSFLSIEPNYPSFKRDMSDAPFLWMLALASAGGSAWAAPALEACWRMPAGIGIIRLARLIARLQQPVIAPL